MGCENGSEDLVLKRIDRGTLPHEGDHVRPSLEPPEEGTPSLEIPEQPVVIIGFKFTLETFTIPLPRGASHDAWPFRPGVGRLLGANQGVKRLEV